VAVKYRILRRETNSPIFETLKIADFVENHGEALALAETYAGSASGRVAIVVADRDTFVSTSITHHTPGSL
jgi:hypothetical protein